MSLPEHKLTVQAGDPTAEITVYDASFNRVGRGVGRYDALQPDGLYEIRVRTAGTREEKLISLTRDETVTIGPVSFASAVPLAATTTTNEAQQQAVVRASTQPPLVMGSGSALLVAVRDRPRRRSSETPPESLASGLSLRDTLGNIIFDFERDCQIDPAGGLPVAVVYMHVNPGTYSLCLDTPNGAMRERSLVAVPGWSTQCFLVRRFRGSAPAADLDQASVSLGRINQPFAPDDRRTRLSEAALDALASNRQVTQAATAALMNEKFEDPMLGLLVGNLLLRDRIPNEPQVSSSRP